MNVQEKRGVREGEDLASTPARMLPTLLIGICLLLALSSVIRAAIAVERWVDARREVRADERMANAPSPPLPTGPSSARARSDEVNWITSDDYPPDSIRREEEGTTSITWTIGTDGRVAECHVTQSSGYTRLDAAACAAIRKRGRYYPARDAQGRAITTTKSRSVIWRLPAA